jgi:hypothetical protein
VQVDSQDTVSLPLHFASITNQNNNSRMMIATGDMNASIQFNNYSAVTTNAPPELIMTTSAEYEDFQSSHATCNEAD